MTCANYSIKEAFRAARCRHDFRFPEIWQEATMDTSSSPGSETVYWALDGGIHHAKCAQRMVLTQRDPLELHFSCLTCTESVRLPHSVVTRIPVAT